MKKILAILLALIMVFSLASLAACGEKKTETKPEENVPADDVNGDEENGGVSAETLDSSKPNEYVKEKLEAGREVMVAWQYNNPDTVSAIMAERFREELPPMGFSYVSSSFDDNATTQIEQIENYVTMGYAFVMGATNDPTAIQDAVKAAEEAGTSFIYYGTIPEGDFYTGAASIDLDALGYTSGLIARAWLDENYPDAGEGEIHVACYGFYLVTETGILSDAIRRSFADDPRCTVVYTDDNCTGIDGGYNATENAFMVDPEIKIVASYDLNAAYGASNFIASKDGANLDKYCVVGTTSNASLQDFLDLTADGKGCFRGTVCGADDPIAGVMQCLNELVYGGVTEKPHVVLEALNAKTTFDFDFDTYFQQYTPAE